MLTSYDQFVSRVHEQGLMLMSNNPWGLPSLTGQTDEKLWHTGEATDPWRWKNLIAAQGHALYAHVPGARLAFIAMDWVPDFLAAFRPREDIEERYTQGSVSNITLRISREYRNAPCMCAYRAREMMGIEPGAKSRFDAAVTKLEREMFLCIGAHTFKKNKKGEPYGWPVNEILLVEAFYAPQLELARAIAPSQAKERIASLVTDLGGNLGAARFF